MVLAVALGLLGPAALESEDDDGVTAAEPARASDGDGECMDAPCGCVADADPTGRGPTGRG
jgi:hypothetical protein